VGVDEAGEQSSVTEIDEFGGVRVIHFCADFYDEAALDQDFAGGGGAAGFDVEQARGVKDDGARRGLGLVCLRSNCGSYGKRTAQESCCKCGERASAEHVFRADSNTRRAFSLD
jgi:hypothetical protein